MSSQNPFDDDEDEIDDETFLRRSRPNNANVNAEDPVERQRRLLMQKRREIEERTLDSSNRSLGLLYESEKVGQATGEELARQKEQLKATEQRLDDINSTLRNSERHLNGIKSIFGGIRNYFAGGSTAQMSNSAPRPPPATTSASSLDYSLPPPQVSASSHPGMRIRGLDVAQESSSSAVDAVLDRNLDEMSMGLGRLKGLAENLNRELDEHNEIIDRLDDKTSTTNLRVERQNRDMNKLLKKN